MKAPFFAGKGQFGCEQYEGTVFHYHHPCVCNTRIYILVTHINNLIISGVLNGVPHHFDSHVDKQSLYFFFLFEHKFDLRSSILWLAFMKQLP